MESINDINYILKQRSKVAKKNICYLNDKDEVVEEEKATKFIITEYDENDRIINSIYGRCDNTIKEEER